MSQHAVSFSHSRDKLIADWCIGMTVEDFKITFPDKLVRLGNVDGVGRELKTNWVGWRVTLDVDNGKIVGISFG